MAKEAKDWKKSYFTKLDNDDVALYLQDYSQFNDDAEVPDKAKRIMASMLCVHENTKARETGICFIDLNTLKRISGCSVAILKRYAEWLRSNDLLDFKLGSQRSSGVSGQASGFTIKFENLLKWHTIDSSENVNALHDITGHNTIINDNGKHGSTTKDILENTTEVNDRINQQNAEQEISESSTGMLDNRLQEISSSKTDEYIEEYGKPYTDEILLSFDDELFVDIYTKILTRDKERTFSREVMDRFDEILRSKPEWVKHIVSQKS